MRTKKKTIRVLICDDYPVWRMGLAQVFNREKDIEVVGEANDGPEAIAMAETLSPDVIIMDQFLITMNGLEALPQICKRCPSAKIIMLTVSEKDSHLSQAISRGVSGYLTKDADPSVIIEAVRAVAGGEVAFSSGITNKLVGFFNTFDRNLTKKEQLVLSLTGDGFTNTQIGEIMGIGESTVRSHLRNIMKKLNLNSRAKVIAYAIENHLTST